MNGHVNGFHEPPSRPFPNGVYCPLVTPIAADETVDIPALQRQVLRLAAAGMGIVLLGTNGEAAHLLDEERTLVIKSARQALDSHNYPDVPLLVGTGGQSLKHTLKLCKEAKAAGADYAIVITPGYFAFTLVKNKGAVKDFFLKVFEASPLPVMIYNFPGAASGIDLDSDLLIELSEHPNCFGAKLTCAGIGKGHRLAYHTQSKAYLQRHPHKRFQVLPGYSDYLVEALLGRHTGCITGTGNVFPKMIVKLYNTAIEAFKSGDPEKLQEALALQDKVSQADWLIVKIGIPGTKHALNNFVAPGAGGFCRSPLPAKVDAQVGTELLEGLRPFWEFEQSLP